MILFCCTLSWHKRNQSLPSLWNASILISSNLSLEPESAHDGDHNSVPVRPKWGGNLISLAIDCFFRQYSCIIFRHKPGSKRTPCTATMICRWNLGTQPPIRINVILSSTYDENTFLVNPARYERQWNESYVDPTITGEVSWWKSWCREINSSPDILRCCVFESCLYCKFEHNPSILRDVFGEMLQPAPYLASVCTKTGFHLMDANTPLNVELSTFIESHLKCIIMSIKLIIRLSFGLKLQNLPDRRPQQREWPARLQR